MKFDHQRAVLNLLALGTALVGLLTLSSTLLALIHLHRARLVIADAHISVIAGISLIYLAMSLRRGKYNAWLVSIAVYTYLLARNFRHFVFDDDLTRHYVELIGFNLIFPAAILVALLVYRRHFKVRSGFANFHLAIKRSLIILAIALLYGVAGFLLMDTKDFHQEISTTQAIHYTIDQYGLTTQDKPVTHSKKAVFFVDSLASASLASLGYVGLAFFSPIRFRLIHHRRDHEEAEALIKAKPTSSEDYFKLWPNDKVYFFNAKRSAFLAYRVSSGVALVVGDPIGAQHEVLGLIEEFQASCHLNDWRPAFIHVTKRNLKSYSSSGLSVQKIGEEAVVDLNKTIAGALTSKYFRHINNKFTKQGYSFELLSPPYNSSTINRLRQISDDWLEAPGRTERGFMMGYFSERYIQACQIAVVRDSRGKIQAYLNQVPTCKLGEANYDFLRHAIGSPGNINDYLMMNFIKHLKDQGFAKLNMGLCPLSGIDDGSSDGKVVDGILNFAYSRGGRFYSFAGLKRFKSKYEPVWEPRYIVYSGGLTGFGRTMSALLRAMSRTA